VSIEGPFDRAGLFACAVLAMDATLTAMTRNVEEVVRMEGEELKIPKSFDS
jgi:hypothetical protein